MFTAKHAENMKSIYIWQQNDWSDFTWDDARLSYKLFCNR